ncbi:tyrosine-type recombinase/integrase [Mycobacteroides abscessus]|uniref:tyrosine-type recombinase/integrase n=1 Tax=Mycobacteroides abscessus TaxID=36809 RepID=UPI0013FD09F1|nr:site-specific integrase [Mycobacteroides abscessus]MBN7314163.1 site-specific integrase [Mycobacteroides abscessus subsp. abscessus]
MAKKRTKAYHGKGQSRSYETKAGTRWSYIIRVYKDPVKPELGKRTAEFGGFRSEKEADAARAKALKDVERGLRVGGKVPTLAEFAESWMTMREADADLESSTTEGDRRYLTVHVLPRIGHLPLEKITTTVLNTLYGQLRTELPPNLPTTGRWSAGNRKPLGANTVAKVATTVGHLLDAAVTDKYLADNPGKGKQVKKPTKEAIEKESVEMTVWTEAQMTMFLKWLRESRQDPYYAMWSTFAATGARRSEVLALQWGDLDLKNRKVTVRRALDTKPGQTKKPKNNKTRSFAISESSTAALREWRRLLAARDINLVRPGTWVFPMEGKWDRHRNRASTSEMFTRRVQWAQKDVGGESVLPTIHLHEVRHSAATILIGGGMDPKTVAERLGHTSVRVTLDIYTHVTQKNDERAADMLDFG